MDMKKLLLILFLCFAVSQLYAQTGNPKYNQALADSLGADERGMKMYVLAILKSGSNKTTDTTVRNYVFKGHMANINKMAADGKLIVAGPLEKNDKSYRGIFILDVPTLDEARTLIQTDPAIKAKIFDVDLFQWYGSAALPMYMKYDKMLQKNSY